MADRDVTVSGVRLDPVGLLRRLWTSDVPFDHEGRCSASTARETGAAGNSTALVGTPDQVADALLDYHVLGITTFLMRGFDPLEDTMGYGT